ncbi:ABC transporter permease [Pullulanibacillus camelliae]|uniref:ABC transporter permease n=1 Tax=Pullulanibacillus camelliae TaxID=1707096 RepID=A0A8J2VCG0_9BACL|nr:sugar ABC transporter permease [Pullulanibacillus camelliae]GGE26105.1 ABC transporter permease [Pullulanibacillus camelliae]
MKIDTKAKWGIVLGLGPALLIYIGFAIVPIIISFYYSFMKWDGFSPMQYVGLDNFKELFKDQLFWHSLKNNVYVILASVIGQLSLALLFALLLNRKLKGAKFFRTIGFMPVVLSSVVVSLTWSLIYNSEDGLLNELLRAVGLQSWTQNWLGNEHLAMISVCVTIIWQFIGLYMIIFLAALQNIPREILEAAEIDGATEWSKTWKIILPMMKDTITAALVLAISGSLKTFDQIYVMTSGGPNHATDVSALYMYNKTFQSLQFGYGSAISVFIFIFGLVLILVLNKLIGKSAV